ncbi:transmembrane protein 230 [Musca domestica]|uniref:Transmembrane protein 230 n=1 Tax=Musca domestica TaxID=7370 RepID=A0A1I8M7J2_MUSDO|nr:transmembrane protein 230 [Musca domestica]
MSRRRAINSSYTPLESEDTQDREYDAPDGFVDEQFVKPERKFPWKTVLFIIFFFIAGATCLTCSILVSSGYISEKYADRAWPLLILGILMFIPGGYYGYILLCICLKRDGFTVEDIPML